MGGKTLDEGRPHTAPVDPSLSAYTHHKCRCGECRQINTNYHRSARADRRTRLPEEFDHVPHGVISTYDNWGCRCVPCADAKSRANAIDAALRKFAPAGSGR